MKKLKILQITNRLPYPLNDGGNIATYFVTRYLHAFGHEVTLASLNTKKHYYDPTPLKAISDVYTIDIDTTFTIPGLLLSFFQSKPYNVQRFYYEPFCKQLRDLFARKNFDIVQLEGIYMALYLPLIRECTSAKIILRSHNIESEIWQRVSREEKHPLKKILLKSLYRKIRRFEIQQLPNFDGIIAITEKDAAFYRNHWSKAKIRTIPVGADFNMLRSPDESVPSGTLCFLGSLEWIPNQQGLFWFLEKVWPVLRKDFPQLEFHVAGKNPPEKIRNIRMDGVVIHGEIPDAVAFLNKHRMLVVPLLSGGGMRLKIIEAMALGKCVVSTSIGAEGINYREGEDLIIADTAEEFAKSLKKLLQFPNLQEETGKRAMQKAREQYSWEKLVRDFENFYSAIL